jgi:CO/xanthine dehydrogenase Mo-binding subunit
LRKPDDRHLRARGQFVADIALRGTQQMVFLRSPYAHAQIGSLSAPPGAWGKVFTAADQASQVTTPSLVVDSPPAGAHADGAP